mgnify:CR=1
MLNMVALQFGCCSDWLLHGRGQRYHLTESWRQPGQAVRRKPHSIFCSDGEYIFLDGFPCRDFY